MKSFRPFLQGYVQIRIRCEKPERFLNLCANHQILVSSLKVEEGDYFCQIPLKDFKKLKPICRKTHTQVRITGKYGLPFFFYRNKKRKAFFIGIFLGLLLIGLLSTRVWNIHIEGNYSNSTQVILQFLDEKNIHHGIAKNKINCSQIATWIRKQYEDVTWVSAKLVGTQLMITVQENEIERKEEVQEGEDVPCNLVADKSGQIVKMVTRQGVPLAGMGQQVKKGEVLVQGQIEILNDAMEIVRYEYVHADADIYLAYQISYENTFPLVYEKRVYTGKEKKQYFLQLFDYRFSLGLPGPAFDTYDAISRSDSLYLTENFLLPIIYGETIEMEYLREKRRWTKEEALEKANEELIRFLQKLLEKGVQIYENNVKIELTDSQCIAKGTLLLVEKIGREEPITHLTQPETPTPEES